MRVRADAARMLRCGTGAAGAIGGLSPAMSGAGLAAQPPIRRATRPTTSVSR